MVGNVSSRAPISRKVLPTVRRRWAKEMPLPLAIQWVQRNGGVGATLDRFKQRGLSQQAASWVSTGEIQPVDAQTMSDVVGSEELSRLSQQLGVPHEQVASHLAEILPQVVTISRPLAMCRMMPMTSSAPAWPHSSDFLVGSVEQASKTASTARAKG
jgi:hypothetical protein